MVTFNYEKKGLPRKSTHTTTPYMHSNMRSLWIWKHSKQQWWVAFTCQLFKAHVAYLTFNSSHRAIDSQSEWLRLYYWLMSSHRGLVIIKQSAKIISQLLNLMYFSSLPQKILSPSIYMGDIESKSYNDNKRKAYKTLQRAPLCCSNTPIHNPCPLHPDHIGQIKNQAVW